MSESKGQHSAIDNRWLTPEVPVKLAHRLMGLPDLDPASEPEANELIQAKRFIAAEEDGLLSSWGDASRIFLNPPGGKLDQKRYPDLFKKYSCTSLPQAFFKVAVDHLWYHKKLNDKHGTVLPGTLFFVGFSLEQLATLSRDEDCRAFIESSSVFIPPDRIRFKLSKEVLDSLSEEDRKKKKTASPSHSNFILVWSNEGRVLDELKKFSEETNWLKLQGVL
jgi:hypothetical protein